MFLQQTVSVKHLLIRIIAPVIVLAIPTGAFAQTESSKLDITRLQLFYQQLLDDPNDTYTQQLIADERSDLRNLIEDELSTTIAPVLEEEYLNEEELTRAVDRQRKVINALQERMRDRKVDLDLLKTEEERFYKQADTATGAELNKFRLTRTYPELLAKKAVLEERISTLESLLLLQESRLSQLLYDQRLQQFALLITIAKYFGIVLLIMIFERLIRKFILSRISNMDHRYTITKFFTSTVYVLTLLWVLGIVFSKNPNLLASLAIVGAGLAIALQDVVKDMLGWFFIVQHRLFNRGNRISVGEVTGEIIDFGLLRTTMLEIGIPKSSDNTGSVLERTGKVLSIPNATFLTKPITNHTTTSDFIRAELRITITFESNWRKCQEMCKQVIDDVTGDFVERDQKQSRYRLQMLYLPHRTTGNQVYFDIAADGVELTMRFTVPIGERRPIVSDIADKLLEEIGKTPDVELAYSTQRILAEMTGNPN